MSNALNLIGQVFGRLTVKERANNDKHNKTTWLCQCSCGNTKIASSNSLRRGDTKSCGCLNSSQVKERNKNRVAKIKDLSGKTFGRLTVLYQWGKKSRKVLWFCSCSCGNTCIVITANLSGGHTKSCGCLKKEVSKIAGKANKGRVFGPKNNLKGLSFGKLEVITDLPKRVRRNITYLCKCSCGNTVNVLGTDLVRGHVRSCGCLQPEIMRLRVGILSSNYNPNKSDEERLLRRSTLPYTNWRKAVLVRDNYTCQCCGKRGCYLNAHHLEDYASNPELRLELDNGVTMCKECHYAFHKIYGTRNQTYTWQFLEFNLSVNYTVNEAA